MLDDKQLDDTLYNIEQPNNLRIQFPLNTKVDGSSH